MSFDLESIKETVQEHPVEIIVGMALIGALGTACYNNKKQREHEIALAKIHAKSMRPPWWTFFRRSSSKSSPALKLVA